MHSPLIHYKMKSNKQSGKLIANYLILKK